MVAGPIDLVRATDPPYGLIRSSRTLANGSNSISAAESPDGELQTNAQGEEPTRWVGGIEFDPDDCGGGLAVDPCGNTGGETVTAHRGVIGPIRPMVAVASVACHTFGTSYARERERAERKLRAVRSYQLEREFWTGTLAQAESWDDNQWLNEAGASTIINSGGAMGAVTAFGELEQAIADGTTWGVGMIHAMPRTVTHWAQLGLVTKLGDLLVSALGTVVVPGRGYPGWGPGDTDNPLGGDAAWAYATSQVFTFLGEITVTQTADFEAVDRSSNERLVSAWQPVAAAHDGCVLAAALVRHDQERSAVGS